MDEVYVLALMNRVKNDPEYLEKLPEDVKQQIQEKLNENS